MRYPYSDSALVWLWAVDADTERLAAAESPMPRDMLSPCLGYRNVAEPSLAAAVARDEASLVASVRAQGSTKASRGCVSCCPESARKVLELEKSRWRPA